MQVKGYEKYSTTTILYLFSFLRSSLDAIGIKKRTVGIQVVNVPENTHCLHEIQ